MISTGGCGSTTGTLLAARGIFHFSYAPRAHAAPCCKQQQHTRDTDNKNIQAYRYTKAHRPWFMHSLFELPSRREALSLEWKIKHQKRRSDGVGVHGRVAAAQRLLAQFPVHRRVF